MNRMIVYETSNSAVFVPVDMKGQPDLSRVPNEYKTRLGRLGWRLYKVTTSKDNELFADVKANGYAIQKVVVEFQEQG